MQTEVRSQRDLGALVKQIRLRHGYTQRELAAALGTSQRYIYEVERGLPKRFDDDFHTFLGKLGITLIAEIDDL